MLRPAQTDDAPAILALRDALARWHLSRGIRQWTPGQVPLTEIQAQIAAGQWHVLDDRDEIEATVRVLDDDPLFWPDAEGDDAGYIHGLMVARSRAGEGLGGRVLAFAEGMIRSRGWAAARLDCVASNADLRSYYEGRGYVFQGIREFPPEIGRVPAALFEKPLD
ncbi:GNAT family N-acetyltransferase [Microbacterium sp. JZ101]